MQAELIRFLRQLIAVTLDKGSAYLFTIYFYVNDSPGVTDFFVSMSLSSFLGPLLMLGNGALITRDGSQNKSTSLSSVISPMFTLNIVFGLFLVPTWLYFDFLILDVAILSLAFMNFAMLMALARSFFGWQTTAVGLLKFFSISLSIIVFGLDKFHLPIYIASAIIFISSYGIKNFNLFSWKNNTLKILSNSTLLLHSLSRWLMNSSDKVLLSYFNVSWADEYTFLYSVSSGISIVGNSIANYAPRLIYVNGDSIITRKLVNFAIFFVFVLTIFLGYVYFKLDSNFRLFSFVFICIALVFNAFTPSITATYIKNDRFNYLALIGISTSFISFMLFYLSMGCGILYFSFVNVITFGIYLVVLYMKSYEKI